MDNRYVVVGVIVTAVAGLAQAGWAQHSAWPADALVLPAGQTGSPTWLEASVPFSWETVLEPGAQLALGNGAAVYALPNGAAIGVTADAGVTGVLALPPDWRWVGLDGQDALWVADASGGLFRAPSVVAGVTFDAFETRGDVPGAVLWDVGADFLVASDGTRLFVATTEGPFAQSLGYPLAGVDALLARHDGVIVAQANDDSGSYQTFISMDRGETWAPSSYKPRGIAREGAWISATSGDFPATLAEDGSWTSEASRWDLLESYGSWYSLLTEAPTPGGLPAGTLFESMTAPGAPPPSETPLRGAEPVDSSIYGQGLGMGGLGMSGALPEATGFAYLHGSWGDPVPQTLTTFAFLADGETLGEGHAATWTRLPHLVLGPRGGTAPRVVTLPADCQPQRVFDAQGVGVLLCGPAEGPTDIWLVDGEGRSFREHTVPNAPADLVALDAAADGTLLFQVACDCASSCRALVRSPVAPGEATAWAWAEADHAEAWRVLEGGRALGLLNHEGTGTAFDLLVVGGNEAPNVVLAGAPLPAGVRLLRTDEGRVAFRMGETWHVIGLDGGLTPLLTYPVQTWGELPGFARAEPVPECVAD